MLSGFVIFSTYGKRIATPIDLVRFQFLRFGRLYPVHFTFLLLFVGFELLKLMFVKNPVSIPFAEGMAGPREFLENLTLTHALGFSLKPDSFNGPSWSISTEFYTYLVFALIALLFAKRQGLVHGILVLALAILLVIDPPELARFSRFITCLTGFFSGCLVAILVASAQVRHLVLPGTTGLLATLAIVVFVASGLRGRGTDLIIMFLLSGTLIVTLVCGAEGLLRRVLRSRPLTVLGEHSYSLYMSHWAVIYMADVILKRSALIPQAEGAIPKDASVTLGLAGFSITFLAVCVVLAITSWASFRFVERPFRLMSRSYAFRKLV